MAAAAILKNRKIATPQHIGQRAATRPAAGQQ